MNGAPRLLRSTALGLAVLFLAACTGGAGSQVRYYLVDPVDLPPLPDATPGLAVEIVDVEVPSYLERFQIATRTSSTGVELAEGHQWAENLRKNLLRTLARNLGRLLDTADVGTPLARSAAPADVRVHLAVEQFERSAEGPVRIAARWQVIPRDPDGIRTYRLDLASERAVAAGDYPAIVAAMTTLYGELARRIAQTLVAAEGAPE